MGEKNKKVQDKCWRCNTSLGNNKPRYFVQIVLWRPTNSSGAGVAESKGYCEKCIPIIAEQAESETWIEWNKNHLKQQEPSQQQEKEIEKEKTEIEKMEETSQEMWLKVLLGQTKDHVSDRSNMLSLYVPPKRSIADVTAQLNREFDTAAHIKSDMTRVDIQECLDEMVERLETLNGNTPEKGIAMFCCYERPGRDGKPYLKLWSTIEDPPYQNEHRLPALKKPVSISAYTCNKRFYTEPLKELYK